MTENKKKSYKINRNFVIVLIIIIIIIAWGWFFKKEKERQRLEEKDKKQNRLKEVEERIGVLQPQKEKIERKEKQLLIVVRIIIGILFVIFNCLNFFYWTKDCKLGGILNFNWAILMGYSFIAFLRYGSINKFVEELKSKFAYQLRKNNFDSLEELEQLIKERDILNDELIKLETITSDDGKFLDL